MSSRVPVGVPVGVMFENDRNNKPPPSSKRLFVGGFLNTDQLSFSCPKVGKPKIAINNKTPATFFIDYFLPGPRALVGNCSAKFQMRTACNGLHSAAHRIDGNAV